MENSFGIAFPLNLDDNGVLIPAAYDIYFKKHGEELEKKLEITIKREDQSVDLCELL